MDGYRLSPQQRHLWPLVDRDPAAYRSVTVIALSGEIDRSALAGALSDLVARHEILRTSFTLADGLTLPMQTIRDAGPVRLEEVPALPSGDDLLASAAALLESSDDPPADRGVSNLRAILAPADEGGVLVIALPAMCADVIGLDVVVGEIAARYAAHVDGGPSSTEAYQYADLAAWQNELLESRDNEGVAYWRTHHRRGALEWRMPLERDHAVGRYAIARVTRSLDEACAARTQAVADHLGVRPADVLLVSWVALLRRWADQADGVVGVHQSGRGYAELADNPGLFAKYLPLDDTTDPEESFAATARRVGRIQTEQSQWQDYFRWDDWSPSGQANPNASRFAYGFEHEPEHPVLSAAGVNFRVVGRSSTHDRFKLCGRGRFADGAVVLTVSYDRALYNTHDVDRLADAWVALIRSAVDDPNQRVGDLPAIGNPEQRWLQSLNATDSSYPAESCVHELIRNQAEGNLEGIAVVQDDVALSFGELLTLTHGVAWQLRARGVGADDRVGLCARRGPEMIVGLLGILEAGAAYVPLDPDYPKERLEQIWRDARPTALVGEREALEPLPASTVPRIELDDMWSWRRADAPDITTHPDNLAYVIYTSGSTGAPKGVMVTHRSLVNSTHARMTYFPMPVSRFLLLASVAFDSSVAGIFWTLCQGGTLVLPRPGVEKSPAEIASHIQRHNVSHVTLLPSVYALLLEEARPGQLASLRMGYLGGEVCPPALVGLHHRTLPDVPLYHAYGPTENTVWSTVAMVHEVAVERRVPVGNPIANVRVCLLDRRLQPVPVGVPGEVCLGGVGLARGYLDDPALTAERFVPDPVGPESGARLYRTGDVALRRGDGALEYVGRTDNQVKVRGYRIELGDVESALRRHPGVADVVAVAREDTPGDRRLAAYFVARERREGGETGYRLRNGLVVDHFDKFQTDAQYRLIFEDTLYTRHGITVCPGDCVFDIGANIGLFSLYVWTLCPDIHVYAFEPAPATHAKLKTNLTAHGLDAQLFDCAVGATDGLAEMRFYPAMTGMSGLHADPVADRQLAQTVVGASGEAWRAAADRLLGDRFDSDVIECRVTRLSTVLRELGLPKIDLLKVDVEKSEEAVFDGIDDADWRRIGQVVAEVHDVDGRVGRLASKLEEHGFRVAIDRSGPMGDADLVTLYGVSPERAAGAHRPSKVATPAPDTSAADAASLRAFASKSLPAFMVPSFFVELEALPVLPNGKVDRGALPAPDAARSDRTSSYVAPRSALERTLADIWAKVLDVDRVGLEDNFFERGGDSILAVRVATLARQHHLWITPRHVFQHQTVGELGQVAGSAPAIEAEQTTVTGSLPLTPVQRWFFHQALANPHLFNMSTTVELEEAVDSEALRRAIAHLVAYHDGLRLRFVRRDGVWNAHVGAVDEDVSFTVLSTDGVAADETVAAIAKAVERLNRSINIESGPMVSFLLVRTAGLESDRLVIVAHHLVTDVVSWQVLLDDLRVVCRDASEERTIQLPLKTSSVKRWAEELVRLANLPDVVDELAFWQTQLGGDGAVIPVDDPAGENTIASASEVHAVIDHGTTRELLTDVPRLYRAEVTDVLLTALALAVTQWSAQTVVGVDIESHGREETIDLDLSRTVGWFTSTYPVRLAIEPQHSPGEALMAIRAQLERVPRHGLGFGLLRWLTTDPSAAVLGRLPSPPVTFNYLGQLDSALGTAGDPFEFVRERTGTRQHVLEFDLFVRNGCLEVSLVYSANLHERATIVSLVDLFTKALRALAHQAHSGLSARDDHLVSSFDWSGAELRDITAAIDESAEDA